VITEYVVTGNLCGNTAWFTKLVLRCLDTGGGAQLTLKNAMSAISAIMLLQRQLRHFKCAAFSRGRVLWLKTHRRLPHPSTSAQCYFLSGTDKYTSQTLFSVRILTVTVPRTVHHMLFRYASRIRILVYRDDLLSNRDAVDISTNPNPKHNLG